MAISESNIHIGYVHYKDGYVKNKSVADANTYEKLFPGSVFIFFDGDRKLHYLTIDEVNKLTINDLMRKDPCDTRQKPCGLSLIHI